jgi:hypothetical protein
MPSLFEPPKNARRTARRTVGLGLRWGAFAVALLAASRGLGQVGPDVNAPTPYVEFPAVFSSETSGVRDEPATPLARELLGATGPTDLLQAPYPPIEPEPPPATTPEPAADAQPPKLWIESLLPDHDKPLGAAERDWDLGVVARGYFLNDQRIVWSGMEATFGAEGVLSPVLRHSACGWELSVEGEFYLNQPFERNMLVTGTERQSYQANFETDTFEVSQLFVSAQTEELTIAIGKRETPFGRAYFPLFTNARSDAPFIRTEAILWRETGVFLRYQAGVLAADVAMTNGCEERDTNSSKALLARLGIDTDSFVAGCSVKVQDGVGSDEQKQFNNHVGADCAIRLGRLVLSSEVIYDQYGFWRSYSNPDPNKPGYDPDAMFWPRSIYYRDLNYRLETPISGIGYYGNLVYQGSRWLAMLNYGEYYPQSIGDPRHDRMNRRAIGKFLYFFTPALQSYTVVMQENDGYVAQLGRRRNGNYVLTGLQYMF